MRPQQASEGPSDSGGEPPLKRPVNHPSRDTVNFTMQTTGPSEPEPKRKSSIWEDVRQFWRSRTALAVLSSTALILGLVHPALAGAVSLALTIYSIWTRCA